MDPVNSTPTFPPTIQTNAVEQDNLQRQQSEQQTVQPTAPQDAVSIRAENIVSENVSETTIENSQQAQQTASLVAGLLQQQPQLAISAQGGQISAEKVDVAIQANIGGVV